MLFDREVFSAKQSIHNVTLIDAIREQTKAENNHALHCSQLELPPTPLLYLFTTQNINHCYKIN